jgi:glycine/D-amino acid oxidase-like deaminating enzyme
MDYEESGGYEIFPRMEKKLFEECVAGMPMLNRQLKTITGKDSMYEVCNSRIQEFGFGNIDHLILNRGEGQINPGKMISTLIKIANDLGIRILNGANAERIEETSSGVTVTISGPNHAASGEQKFSIKTGRLLICVNGYAQQFLPDIDLKPARAQVLITTPIANLKMKGCFHYDRGYYYFRNIDDRILFGGGRNLDPEGETTTATGTSSLIQSKLEEILSTVILPGKSFDIDMRWSGIMGLGSAKSPIVQPTGRNVFCAVRMGGMGIAIGSLTGRDAAEMIHQSF